MKDLAGKYAVVTGAGKGIGATIAKRFLEENAAGVAILDLDEQLAEARAAELRATGKNAIAVQCNVANPSQVQAAVARVFETFPRIDILVNNAGITRDRIFHKMSDDEWQAVIDVNLNGTYYVCRSIVPSMRENKTGSIINIASTSVNGNPGQANYSASKAALQGFTRTLALELGPKNVRVNCIAPGYIHTDMLSTVLPEKLDDVIQNKMPMHRLGEPEEVAGVAAFLAGEDASWITGQTIYVSGGSMAG